MGFKPQIRTLFWAKIKNLLLTDVSSSNELIKCSIKRFCQKTPFSSNFYCASMRGPDFNIIFDFLTSLGSQFLEDFGHISDFGS